MDRSWNGVRVSFHRKMEAAKMRLRFNSIFSCCNSDKIGVCRTFMVFPACEGSQLYPPTLGNVEIFVTVVIYTLV